MVVLEGRSSGVWLESVIGEEELIVMEEVDLG